MYTNKLEVQKNLLPIVTKSPNPSTDTFTPENAAIVATAATALRPNSLTTNNFPVAKLMLHYVAGSCFFEKRSIELEANVPCEIGRSIVGEREPCQTNAYFDCRVLSRNQAIIWCNGFGQFWLQDRQSTNGSYLNGNQLDDAAVELHCGDILQFGRSVLTATDQSLCKCIIARVGLVKISQTSIYKNLPVIINKAQLNTFVEFLEIELQNVEEEIFQTPLKNELLNLIDEQLIYHETAKEAMRKATAERHETQRQLDQTQEKLATSVEECQNLRETLATMKSAKVAAKERLRLQMLVCQECNIERSRLQKNVERRSQQRIERLQRQIEACNLEHQNLSNTLAEIKRKRVERKYEKIMRSVEAKGYACCIPPELPEKNTNILPNEVAVQTKPPNPTASLSATFIEQQSNNDNQVAAKINVQVNDTLKFSDCNDDFLIQQKSIANEKPQQQTTAAVQTTASLLAMSVGLFNEIYEDVFTHRIRTYDSNGNSVRSLCCLKRCNRAADLETRSVVRLILTKVIVEPEDSRITAYQCDSAPALLQHRRCYGGQDRTVGSTRYYDNKVNLQNSLVPIQPPLKPIHRNCFQSSIRSNQSLRTIRHRKREIILVPGNSRFHTWIPFIMFVATAACVLAAFLIIMNLQLFYVVRDKLSRDP